MSCPTTVSSTTAPVEPAGPAHQGHNHHVEEQLVNLHNERDHGDQLLRRDRNVLDDQHHRDIGHRVEEQLGNLDGPTKSLDHGKASAPRRGYGQP